MLEKSRTLLDFIEDNWIQIILVVTVIGWFGFMGSLIISERVEKDKISKYVRGLSDSEQLEIFKGCYSSYDFNCLQTVKDHYKLKTK